MEDEIIKIHQAVFDLLIEYNKKDPDNFFFTLRQINRASRLDKGYWFLGNEKYLAISFWKGRDQLNRTPRISFIITKKGETSLLLSSRDADDIFHINLKTKLKINNLIYDHGFHKNYESYSPKFYLQSLIDFINNDKKIIDEAIKDNNCISPGKWLYYADSIEFISKSSFLKNLTQIKAYQKKRKNTIQEFGYLKSFTIKNYGLIKEITISDLPLNNRWLFITGENGAGKTTLLRALAIGICKNSDNNKPIDNISDFEIDIHLSSKHKDLFYHVNKKNVNRSSFSLVKGFAAYGPIRLITESNLDNRIFNNEQNIHEKLTFGLFNPIGILKDLYSPFPLLVKPKYMEMAIENIIENLNNITSNYFEYIHRQKGELCFFEYDHNKEIGGVGIPFSKLPSGTRNYVSLILDLLISFQKQQPDIYDMANYKGVVIIDEIDIHLHPKLQIEFIKQLSETFPKVQFIVTTHSPIPLLGAPANSAIINVKRSLKDGVVAIRLEKLEKEIKYLLPNTILTSDIFDFDFFETKKEEFDKLNLEDKYDDIENHKIIDIRLKNLKKDIFPDDLFSKNK